MAKIELVNLCKKFDAGAPGLFAFPFSARDVDRPRAHKDFAIRNLNLTIPHAQTLVILGPSGCGKTTLLKMIAGLIVPDAGEIFFNGKTMNDVPPANGGSVSCFKITRSIQT